MRHERAIFWMLAANIVGFSIALQPVWAAERTATQKLQDAIVGAKNVEFTAKTEDLPVVKVAPPPVTDREKDLIGDRSAYKKLDEAIYLDAVRGISRDLATR